MHTTHDSGNIATSYEYDSFGNPTTTGNITSPYSFTGREYDPESGLYYYRARYYNPQTGRFISEDPIGFDSGDINLYRYVNNSPLNYTDPSGLCPCGVPQDVINNARKDKRDWSQSADRTDINSGFGPNTYKCNLFVDTTYGDSSFDLPNIGGNSLLEWLDRYPPGAQSLSDKNYDVPGWPVVSDPPQPGDLLAEKGHVGIAVGENKTISAAPKGVVENDWGFRTGQDPVIRRCSCK